MASFSAMDAAFAGFRLAGRHPKTILAWIGLYFVVTMVLAVAMTVVAGPAMAQLQAAALSGAAADPAQNLAAFGRLAPVYAIAFPLTLAIYAMSYAAVNRLVLRPDEPGFVHLRLGGAEFNQFIILIVVGIALVLSYVVGLLLMVVVIGVVTFAFVGLARSAPVLGGVGAALSVLLSFVAIFVPLVFVGVRLSLASAMTFDLGAPAFRRAWRLTRGHFWRILGAYVVLWATVLVALLVFAVIAGALAFALAQSGQGGFTPARFATMFTPPATLAGLLGSPASWLGYLLLSGFYVMGFALTVGCPAEIYRHLTASAPDKVAETF